MANTGQENSGNWNLGNWNSGDLNSGFFCTGTPSPTFFDQPAALTWEKAYGSIPWIDLPVGCAWVPTSSMTDEEKAEYPNHTTIGGYLKVLHKDIREAFPVAWAKLDDATRQRFLDLPNFDAEKFLEITGVDVRVKQEQRLPEAATVGHEVLIDGVTYVPKQ